MRNPKWSRDEVILALDFYHRFYPKIPSKTSQEIKELSESLRKLRLKLDGNLSETYRNVNGVYMKLMNFHPFNLEYSGASLKNTSKLDGEIFSEFENDFSRRRLRKISQAILDILETERTYETTDIDDDKKFEVQEGTLLTRFHRYRERDRKIISRKKAKIFKDTGHLQCEGCRFDFRKKYGEHGNGFIECHHTKPLFEIKIGEKTSLDDLSLVCSNCHRMIHRHRHWLPMEELRDLVVSN